MDIHLPKIDPSTVQVPVGTLSMEAQRMLGNSCQPVMTAARVRDMLAGSDVLSDAAVEVRHAVVEAETAAEAAFYDAVGTFIFHANLTLQAIDDVGGKDWSAGQERVLQSLWKRLARQLRQLRWVRRMHPRYPQVAEAIKDVEAVLPRSLHPCEQDAQ